MKATYDAEADALLVRFSNTQIQTSEELSPGIVFDYDASGGIVGFEILDAKDRLSKDLDIIKMGSAA